MDLLTEASSGTRVLTARHISTDKILPETTEAINTTLLCYSYSVYPDFESYYSALQWHAWVLWSTGLLLYIAVWVMYAITLRAAFRHWQHNKVNVAVILSIYPMVAGAAYITLVVPRARVFAEAIAQESVMIALYHFFNLVISECGGPEHLVAKASGSHFETRVPPCCCWPCCIIPQPKLERKHLDWLRYLVLQVPLVQAFLYVLLLVIWADDFMTYHNNLIYFQPFVAASILSGIWGVLISVSTVTRLGYNPRPRFIVLQLVLIIVKIQCGAAKMVGDLVLLPCVMALHPTVFVNMIQNSLIMLEMLLISILAWRLYRIPPGKNSDKTQKITTVEDNFTDLKFLKESIDNKSFNKVSVVN